MSENIYVNLPDAPDLTDLRFRHFRDENDFAALVRVIEACQGHDHVDPLSPDAGIPTVAELTESFAHAENIDLSKDMLIVELAGRVIGFQWVRWWTQADGTWVYYHRGRIIPEWRGHGIGTATMRWAERHIRQRSREHPTGGKAVFQANTTMHEKEYNELLLTEGYVPVHSFIEMGYDEACANLDVTLPAGFETRSVTKEDYRAIWEANEEAFADEWGHRSPTNADYARFLANIVSNPGFDPTLWQVAWRDGAIAGVALCEITERGVGEITDLSVRKAYRGQGLARALIARAVLALQARKLEHIRIFTDADDALGARSLYESVGFRVLTEYIRYQKPVE